MFKKQLSHYKNLNGKFHLQYRSLFTFYNWKDVKINIVSSLLNNQYLRKNDVGWRNLYSFDKNLLYKIYKFFNEFNSYEYKGFLINIVYCIADNKFYYYVDDNDKRYFCYKFFSDNENDLYKQIDGFLKNI